MLHKAIRLLRMYKDIPQHEISRLMELDQSRISNMEKGKHKISIEVAERYAKIFSLDISFLLMFADKLENKKGLEKAIFQAIVTTIKEF